MCIVEDLTKECLSTENILKYIDDYSIYSFYIGKELELNARYSSPLREDKNPSFSLFSSSKDNRIYFKDHATSWKGDVFQFVRILMSLGNTKQIPFTKVLQQIDNDFNLGLYFENGNDKKTLKPKVIKIPQKDRYTIAITSHKYPKQEFIDYWKDKYDISLVTLKEYNCTNVEVIHYKSKTHSFQIYPKTLAIAYQIGGKYKLYFPFECKSKKFQNNFPENWIEGYLQLKYKNDFCIITKAMKEVMFFREHFDWDSIAGKSENTKIPKHLMDRLFKNYKKVFIWLDKDTSGINAQKEYTQMYPDLIPIVYPDFITQKDPTDRYEFLKKAGLQKVALKEIKDLIIT
jgi:hypothetical protein